MDINEMINQVTTGISQVTESFYQGKDNEGYLKLNGVISDLMSLIEKMIEYKGSEESQGEEQLMQTVTEAMNALEQKDTILLSDILQYDLADQLQSIAGKY